MSRALSHVTKAHQGSHPGNIRVDERARNSLPRSPIHIAPRPFVYDPLQPGEIRLLEIRPSKDRSTRIRAALRRQALRYATYEALSHVCGDEELRETIDVDGQPLSISSSLLGALHDLRSEEKDRTLWVDSVCINQNDGEERGKQARLEAEILEHATAVVSWPWNNNGNKGTLDDTALAPWLIPSRTLSPIAWDTVLPHVRDTPAESENSFDLTGCEIYFGSTPALTSSPRSPQTTSASSSPGSSTDSQFQEIFSEGMPYEFGADNLFVVSLDGPELQQLLPGREAVAMIPNTSQHKRSLATAFPDDLPTHGSRKGQQTQTISTGQNEAGPNVVFACPFHRSNPQKYHRCLKYTLNRIKDVKQHIYRQHSRPTLYCARCYEVFTTTEDRDAHSRRADCNTRSPPQFEGITEQQRNELKKSSPKKKPLDEQWFELWEVVFPGRRRPQSPFIGNHVEEVVPLLRDLWNEKQAEIISGVMESMGGRAVVEGDLLREIMRSVFDRFEAETIRSTQGRNTELPAIRTEWLEHTRRANSGFNRAELCSDFPVAFKEQELSQMGVLDFDLGCVVDMENYYPSQGTPTLLDTDLAK